MPLLNRSSVSRFSDITIYRRIADNNFISLTENELACYDKRGAVRIFEIADIEEEFDYCISVLTGNSLTLASGITLEEILLLAGISGKGFIRQLQSGMDENIALDLTAEMCAKKILCYSYGKCTQELKDNSGSIYINFSRTAFLDGRTRKYPIVLSKPFKNIPIKVREVNIWQAMMNQTKNNGFTVIR